MASFYPTQHTASSAIATPVVAAEQAPPTNYSGYVQAAGLLAQAMGAIQQGAMASSVAGVNADIARVNAHNEQQAAEAEARQADYAAQVAEMDAELALQAAQFREQQLRLVSARKQGMNRAIIGASGVAMAGSPLQMMVDNAYEAEKEARMTRYAGELEALAHRREADLLRYQGAVKRWGGRRSLLVGDAQAEALAYQGSMANLAGYITAAGGVASGVGRYAYSAAPPTTPQTPTTPPTPIRPGAAAL